MNCDQIINWADFQLNCSNENNCDNELCQGYVTGIHQISFADHEIMVRNYFNGNMPLPQQVAAQTLIQANTSCQGYFIQYDSSETRPNDNQDVIVSLEEGHSLNGKYSITLFKGILKLFNPDLFAFSKARCPLTGVKTLAFLAIKNGNVVYCGDLSGLWP